MESNDTTLAKWSDELDALVDDLRKGAGQVQLVRLLAKTVRIHVNRVPNSSDVLGHADCIQRAESALDLVYEVFPEMSSEP